MLNKTSTHSKNSYFKIWLSATCEYVCTRHLLLTHILQRAKFYVRNQQ
jgi:hypothetical protein